MFSVILPVYNGEKIVKRAIECVRAQTFPDWELIIVNDGSEDHTGEVLKEYANDPKIKIITQENQGVSAARNAAMKLATQDYFAFLDADDLWLANHLEVLKELIDAYPDAGTFTTLGFLKLQDGGTLSNLDYFENRDGNTEDMVYIDNYLKEYDRDKKVKTHSTCSCVSRAAAEKAGGFRAGCKIGEDLAFFMLAGLYYPVVLSPKHTATYDKSNSVATKDVSFDPDWYFFDEVEQYYHDETLSEEKKDALRSVMQWFTMRRSRHYIIDGNKKKAWKSYHEIGKNPKLKKDKFLTLILLFLPVFVARNIFEVRWRSNG